MNVKRILLVTMSLAAAASPARADTIKVAVVPSILVNLDAAKVDALSQDLASALASELVVDAIGGLEVRRRLPVDGLPPDCATTPACASDTARRLDVTQLLFVVMVDSGAGGTVQVDSTWVEPSSGHHAARPAVVLTSIVDADAKAKFASVARQLLPDAKVRPKKPTGPNVVGKAAVPHHFTLASKLTTGGAIVALGAGVALGLVTSSKYNTCAADLACAGSDNSSGTKSSIRALGIGADVGFGVAITCTVATAILYATSGEVARAMIAPAPLAGGAALVMTGRF